MKTSIDSFGTRVCTPLQAFVFYGSGGKATNIEFATVHAVTCAPGQTSRLGPGRPITVEAMKAVAESFAEKLRVKPAILREQVLLANDDMLVWWTPARKRLCFFDVDWHAGQPGRDALQGVSANLPIPPMVWALRRTNGRGVWQGMHVWSLKDDTRPSGGTPLFRAPLLNVNDDGQVCWGSGAVPKGRTQADIEAWEDAFFASVFSHYNQSTPFAGAKAYEVLARMVRRPPRVFPAERLIPMRTTLQACVDRLLGVRE